MEELLAGVGLETLQDTEAAVAQAIEFAKA